MYREVAYEKLFTDNRLTQGGCSAPRNYGSPAPARGLHAARPRKGLRLPCHGMVKHQLQQQPVAGRNRRKRRGHNQVVGVVPRNRQPQYKQPQLYLRVLLQPVLPQLVRLRHPHGAGNHHLRHAQRGAVRRDPVVGLCHDPVLRCDDSLRHGEHQLQRRQRNRPGDLRRPGNRGLFRQRAHRQQSPPVEHGLPPAERSGPRVDPECGGNHLDGSRARR